MLDLRPPIEHDPFRDNLPVAKRNDATVDEVNEMIECFSTGVIDVVTAMEGIAMICGWGGEGLLGVVDDSPTPAGKAFLQWRDGQLCLCLPLDHYCHDARLHSGQIDPSFKEGSD